MNDKSRISRSSPLHWMLLTDLLMSLIFLLLFSLLLSGLKIHELAGIVFFALMVLHLLFSWTRIRQSAGKIRQQKDWRKRINTLLNAALFILVVVEVSSGLVISQVLVPALGIKTINSWSWRLLHSDCSRIILVIISVHIAVNWRRIRSYRGIHWKHRSATASNTASLGVRRNKLQAAVLIVLTAVAIGTMVYFIKGAPSVPDKVPRNAIARFKPMLLPGIVQYFGGAIVISILVYIAHRWLKLRL